MWKFIRKYLHYAVIGALLMVGEVFMDLLTGYWAQAAATAI